jgi:hypothetical protein
MFFFLQPSEEHVSISEGAPIDSTGSTTASNSGGFKEAVKRTASFIGGALLNVDSRSELDAVIKIQKLESSIAVCGIKIIGR